MYLSGTVRNFLRRMGLNETKYKRESKAYMLHKFKIERNYFMKRKIFLSSLLLLFIFAIFIYSNKQNDVFKKSELHSNINLIEGVKESLGTLNITVDPKIELLTAVQQQAEYDVLSRFDFDYKEEMNEYFNTYKNHKVVKTFNKLRIRGFSYDAPPNVMLYLSNNLTVDENTKIPDDLIARASGEKKLSSFINELKDFSYESDFNKLYEQNIPFYQAMIDNVYDKTKDMELIDSLDSYYGMEVNSYNLILSPLLHAGGYGPKVEADNGLYDVYGIIGPDGIINNDESVIPDYSSEAILYIVWHEFSHSFVNPTTEKFIDEISMYGDLYSKIEKQMESQAYTNWQTCVNEHIVRAITARLIYLNQGQSAYDSTIAKERANGFYYVPALCDSFAKYEENRGKYPTFESYYPELINVFKELSEQELGEEFFKIDFLGPINASFNNLDSIDIAIIMPTNEKNAEIQDEIYFYVEKIKDKFFPNAEMIKDTEALNRDLGDYTIIAYGTFEGNTWLQEHKDSFPFKVEEDKITADKVYGDTGMIMISAMPNPQNYKNPLVIYTAQDSEDIIEINNVFHGPTDFIISKDGEELYSGFYDKNKENWSFPMVEQ